MNDLVSIVIPCHNEEKMLPIYFKEMIEVEVPSNREYIFVNDGSTDQTLKVIKELHKNYPENVNYLSFSRNFGKEEAMLAGLRASKGEYVVIMDADLQDPPHLLPKMYELISEAHYDCVGTKRITRDGEPKIRSFFSNLFYKINNRISDTQIEIGERDYRIMTKQMVDAILELNEYNRFSKGIFSWVGFDKHFIEFENHERKAGETSWSFWNLFKYSVDGIVNHSEVPLTLATLIGWLSFMVSLILSIFFTFRTLLFDNPTPGWTSTIVILLGMGGIQLLTIGILGKYIGKIYMESKKRPHYFIKEENKKLDGEKK